MSAQAAPVYPLYMQAVLLPVISFVSILLSVVPLVLHWNNRNVAASSLICWYMILNVFNIINAILWPTDDVSSWWDGKGLCDFEGKIMIASYIAVPGTLVCIFRGLACVLDTRRAALVPTKSQRWWNRGMTLLFCFMAPAVATITQIIYQGGRYFVFAISGCVNSYDETWVTLVLAYIWPLIICLIAGYYCGMLADSFTIHTSSSNVVSDRSASSQQISKSVRRHNPILEQQHEQISIRAAFLARLSHALGHYPCPDLRRVYQHPAYPPVACVLLGSCPSSHLERDHQSPHNGRGILRPLDSSRIGLHVLHFLWQRS